MKLEVNRRNALLLVAVVAVVAVLAGRQYLGEGDRTDGRSMLPTIGGPFTLIDQTGKTVKNSDLEGRVLLIFFGYTFCPDVCPTALTIMAEALDLLGAKADDITPVFITVDPQRDTPEVLKSFIENFHPSIVGLTGSPEQIAAIAKSYHAYYMKVIEGEEEADEGYLMYHISNLYLMAPGGKFLARFPHDIAPEALAAGLRKYL